MPDCCRYSEGPACLIAGDIVRGQRGRLLAIY